MGETTKIEWADRSWSPWLGCMKVSTGEKGACEHCYAQVMTEHRFHRVVFGGPGIGVGTRDLTSDGYWKQPLRWQRDLASAGRRETVFPSLCDPFDKHVDPEWRQRFFDLIRATPNLIWLLLTKRPQNIHEQVVECGGMPRNAALGCTVVTPEEARRDLPIISRAAARLNALFWFISAEPLMGDIAGEVEPFLRDRWRCVRCKTVRPHGQWATRYGKMECGACMRAGWVDQLERFAACGWVIPGGESGPHARPSHPDCFRNLRDVCGRADVPFLFKQWGEMRPATSVEEATCNPILVSNRRAHHAARTPAGDHRPASGCFHLPHQVASNLDRSGELAHLDCAMVRVGKKVAGRLLDGVEHNGFPKAIRP